MENHPPLKQAGQASIEFILLLVMVLLLLQTVVLPNITVAERIMNDTQKLSKASAAGHTLAQAINDVNAGAIGSRQTVRLLLDDRIFLACGNKALGGSNYPDSWGTRLMYVTMLDYTQDPPLSLPGNYDNLSDQPVVAQNGGGCQLFDMKDNRKAECGSSTDIFWDQNYLRCYGTIPINVDCSQINNNDLLNLKSGVWCGQKQDPVYRNVQVEKKATGVTITLVS